MTCCTKVLFNSLGSYYKKIHSLRNLDKYKYETKKLNRLKKKVLSPDCHNKIKNLNILLET